MQWCVVVHRGAPGSARVRRTIALCTMAVRVYIGTDGSHFVDHGNRGDRGAPVQACPIRARLIFDRQQPRTVHRCMYTKVDRRFLSDINFHRATRDHNMHAVYAQCA